MVCIKFVAGTDIQMSLFCRLACACVLTALWLSNSHADTLTTHTVSLSKPAQIKCLSTGEGLFKARLSGVINAELDWHNDTMNCAGSVRPNGGLRLRFSQSPLKSSHPLVLIFGINGVRVGENGKQLAASVTIMREGKGEFYGTQGDKCLVDVLKQSIVPGLPTKRRSYRVEAHGFCNQPARALNGDGVVLITRFDFVGRIDLLSDDDTATNVSASS
jgi:hypothetical protein